MASKRLVTNYSDRIFAVRFLVDYLIDSHKTASEIFNHHSSTMIFDICFAADHRRFGRMNIYRIKRHPLVYAPRNFVHFGFRCVSLHIFRSGPVRPFSFSKHHSHSTSPTTRKNILLVSAHHPTNFFKIGKNPSELSQQFEENHLSVTFCSPLYLYTGCPNILILKLIQ